MPISCRLYLRSLGQYVNRNQPFADQQPFRCASYYWDSEVGMYFLINRYYDPKIMRFLSKDPAEDPEGAALEPQEQNAYVYVKNNPVMGADPAGLYWDGNANYHRLLSYGSRGEDVRVVQIGLRLADVHFQGWLDGHGGADGIFGPATDKLVRMYQTFFGLTVDGIVGPQTWGHLVPSRVRNFIGPIGGGIIVRRRPQLR